MPNHETYLLDANVFIEAKRRYYAFDLCPGFWDALILHQTNTRLCSIDRVKNELERGKDDLTEWATSILPDTFFGITNENAVVNCFAEVVRWVQNQQFSQEAKAEFVNGVDAWLIAYAKAKKMILVTHEVLAPEARKKVPIPNVCVAFNVQYRDTFEMLRKLETRFILEN